MTASECDNQRGMAMRDSKVANLQLNRQDGFAMVSVLFIIALLSTTVVPLMDMVRRNKESQIRQQITSKLVQEARENLEVAVYLVKAAEGVPDGYSNTPSSAVTALARSCSARITAIDPAVLGTQGLLNTATTYSTRASTASNRLLASFVVNRSNDPRFLRFVIVTCASAETGEIGIYAAEIAALNGAYYTLSFGQF